MTDRIAVVFAKSLGLILSKLPFSFLEKATEFLAWSLMSIPNSRRRLLISNLRHAFPDWEYAKILSVARESSARMFEMGFFSLCYPNMSKNQLRHTVFYDDDTEAKLEELRKTGKPVLMLIPHTCLFETLATSPFFRPFGGRSLGAIYRPNKNPLLDKWITKARCKVGIVPFSRKEGVIKARSHLKKGNWLAVLYDQNAGHKGLGTLFMNRMCSVSPLPNLFSKNENVIIAHAVAKRLSFFKSKLFIETFEYSENIAEDVHKSLETQFRIYPKIIPEWLWMHGKWKINNQGSEYFSLQSRFHHIDFSLRNESANSLIIRVPNWLGDIVMALPLIRAIRENRPDLKITIFCKHQYHEWLKSFKFVDSVISIDNKKLKYLLRFYHLRKHSIDSYLVFTNSLRGDIEAFLSGADQRFGLCHHSNRPLLNRKFRVLENRIPNRHQTHVWFQMLCHFGLPPCLSLEPFSNYQKCDQYKILNGTVRVGIAPGSSNSPSKRLSHQVWVQSLKLIEKKCVESSLICEIELIGTLKDRSICDEIENALIPMKVTNCAGETSLVGLTKKIRQITVLICNDSGAMHLANSLGTPLIAVFIATDSRITGPIFNGCKMLVEPGNDKSTNEISTSILSKFQMFISKT